jgi:hypothetical protein
MKIKQRSRLAFERNYIGQNIYVVFEYRGISYRYPHDELLDKVLALGIVSGTKCWEKIKGSYNFRTLSEELLELLADYKIA